jgi:hypothetical protein
LFLYHRSGTEEQYGELQQLLDDGSAYITDMQNKKTATKVRKQLQEELDRNNAEQFRDDAMVAMRESKLIVGINAGDRRGGGATEQILELEYHNLFFLFPGPLEGRRLLERRA